MSTWEFSSQPDPAEEQPHVAAAATDAANVPAATDAADVPAADVPAADVPAADVPAADVPAADVPAAADAEGVPAADAPTADTPAAGVPGTARGGEDELSRLTEIPLADHPAIFERIHADLQAALADIDSA